MSFPRRASRSPEAPDLHINNVNAYHGRLKEWMRRFHGLGYSRTCPATSLDGDERSRHGGDEATPQNWYLGAIGMGVIANR